MACVTPVTNSLISNADISFHAASTMKVPIMIELFRRVDSRTVSLDQTVPVENCFLFNASR
jgi:beta-lactamase class A